VIGTAQNIVFLLLVLASLAVQVFAIADAARRPANAFTSEGKLTKPIWLTILIVAGALTFAIGGSLYSVILVAPALIYLADVRPRVLPYSRPRGGGRGGSGGGRGGSGGRSSGGW
jgi:uncharacterized membrane protein YgcG